MNVPDGWRAATLGELAVQARPGFASGKHSRIEGGVQHLRPMNITRLGRLDLADAKYVEDTSDRRVALNDVIFINTNSPALIGKTALITAEGAGLAYSNHMTRLRMPREGDLLPAYLGLFLHHLWEKRYFESICSNHVNQASVGARKLLETPVSFPPLPEQRRIVELVEEHMAHLDAADASLASAEQRARALTASSRANLVSEGQRLGVDSTVGAHSTEVAYGSSSKTSDASDGVPVLRMGNIQDGQLDWSSLKYLPRDHAEFPKLLLRDGDLLFNRTNSAELVGKSAVFRGERSASYASYLIRVRFDDTVLPEWANLCINSPQGRAHVKSVLAQQVGQANVNGTKLKAFPLPVPPVEDQRRLLESADRARQEALRTTQTTHTTRRRSAALRRAVLTAAFSGHLTSTTDPSDLLQESIA